MERKTVNVALYLLHWVREYRDGPIQWLGYPKTNIFHRDHGLGSGGTHSNGLTKGDLAQDAYMAMLRSNDYVKFAHVLAMKAFNPHWIHEDIRRKLLQVGIVTPAIDTKENREDFDTVIDAWYQHAIWIFAHALLNGNKLPENIFRGEAQTLDIESEVCKYSGNVSIAVCEGQEK